MKIRKVALIIFYDDKKRILLQDRRGISRLGEEWGYFGGEIEKDETPEQAVIRETKEELDFDLKECKYIGEYSDEIKDLFVVRKVFISTLKNNLLKFKQKEGINMNLFSLEEAEKLKMVSKGDIQIIRRLKKIL
jgi:8-oxo-dGTP pyrophosphatase MutT (NUDIX family)